ncbi:MULTISPECIES: glycosyltransferase family 2 protein [Mycobacteriaceae]|uniref:glycosyltransferase family 2 protein n=1 Tax=Mycobacteriaceae TaxID=1762 RepID=UPI0009DB7A2B|nr:glycosyltransferase family 2 protein [Mycolicibacterium neoaurum]
MSNPRVSVVIPTYNRVHVLGRAIASVLNQTVPVHEVIVVDDGSDDGSSEMVIRLSRQDPRIVLLRQARGGAPSARNRGIAYASGSLLAFQDSDDEWNPRFIATLLECHTKPGVIAFCSMTTIDASGKSRIDFPEKIDNVRAQLLRANCISTQSCLVDSTLLRSNSFDVRLQRLQDWDLWLSLIDKATFIHVPEVLVTQYIQSDSITAGSERKLYAALKLITKKHRRVLSRRPLWFAKFWIAARLRTFSLRRI